MFIGVFSDIKKTPTLLKTSAVHQEKGSQGGASKRARALWDPLAIDHQFWWVNKKMLTCDFIALTSTQGWCQATGRVIWLYEAA